MSERSYGFETIALHGGQVADPTTTARAVPIYRTSSYEFRDTTHAADLFGLKEFGNIYTRIMNPTTDVLEQRAALLENGAAALALASGTAAVYYSIINICSAGDEIVSAKNLYGGTYTMFDQILPQFGIKVILVDESDIDNYDKAINEKTRLIFIETIGNPKLQVADIEAIAKVAQKHNIPLVVDSTFTPPCLLKPLDYGATVVVHSLTKWMGGHGNGIGGVVIDSGKFDWTDPKFKLYNEPEPSYGGLRFAHDLGDMNPVAFILRMRLVPLRNLGACISPDNAWQFLQGIETLPLRMERHCENSIKAAEFLNDHQKISWVIYPGLEGDPSYEIAQKYLKNGAGAIVAFGVKAGREAAEKLINNLQLFSQLANVGDAKSLVLHPASTTHSQLSEKQLIDVGITPEFVRLSIGIETIDDIIWDLEQALDKI